MKKILGKLNCLIVVVAYVAVVLPIELFVMNTLMAFGYWVEECVAAIKYGGRNVVNFCESVLSREEDETK